MKVRNWGLGLLLIHTTAFAGTYLGCYSDSSNRALPYELISSGATVESCLSEAVAQGYAYAGLQYGGQCFAGFEVGYSEEPNSDCNMPCSADKAETCGGVWLNSIYATGIDPKYTYEGCYTDTSTRALPNMLISSGATVESCVAAAAAGGYEYAGVQYGGQCFAGNSLGYTKEANSDCSMECSANSAETCGGSWLNSIYATGVTPVAPAKPAPVINSFKIVSSNFQIGEFAFVTLSWSASNASYVELSFPPNYSTPINIDSPGAGDYMYLPSGSGTITVALNMPTGEVPTGATLTAIGSSGQSVTSTVSVSASMGEQVYNCTDGISFVFYDSGNSIEYSYAGSYYMGTGVLDGEGGFYVMIDNQETLDITQGPSANTISIGRGVTCSLAP